MREPPSFQVPKGRGVCLALEAAALAGQAQELTCGESRQLDRSPGRVGLR